MSVDDAIRWLETIAGLYDGTAQSGERIIFLSRELMERPESFVDVFFATIDADSPVRAKAEQLVRSGAITTDSTFADLARTLEKGDAL